MNKATNNLRGKTDSKVEKEPKVQKPAPGVKPWSLRLLLIYAGIGFFVFWSWSQVGPQIFSAIAYNFAVLSVLTIAATFTRTIVLRRLLAMFLWGACMSGIAVVLSRAVTTALNGYGSHNVELAMAPIEELLKLLPLFALLFVGRKFSIYTLGLTDFLLAGAAIGAGFSCVEYAAVHAHGAVTGQLTWLPTSEIVNGRMISGHLIWTSLAAFGIGFAFLSKSKLKLGLIVALIAVAVSILDHTANNYGALVQDWLAATLHFITIHGYLCIALWLLSVVVAIGLDSWVLIKAVPQFTEFKIPKGLEGLDGLMAMWDFVVDRRRLAFSLNHYSGSSVKVRKEAALTSSLLAQTLINFHTPEKRARTLASITQLDSTVVSDLSLLGSGEIASDNFDDIDLPSHYRLLAPLSEGGMGIIYRGEHLHTGAKLAIKLLHPTVARQPAALERFKQEAKAVGALKHPNLVTITDFGITERKRIPYLVMELIPGLNLEQILKTEGISPGRFFNLFDQVLDALSHAHKRFVIHRDLKPSNLVLTNTDDGREFVKIVDFGIAKITSTDDGENTQELTRTGDLIGSPLYMSPEQGLGTRLDARSDIYSIACVMYECIVGRPPIMGSNAVQTIMMHVNQVPPSLREARPDLNIPPGIDFFVMKALEKDPVNRYQTMDEMKEALNAVRVNPNVPPQVGTIG